jgi:hypothetical protein
MDQYVQHDPATFYRLTLAANGIEPVQEDMVKFASAQQIPLEVAELAKRYFEQSQLDSLKYASPSQRMQDAVALATAYVEHQQAAFVETAKTADAVMDVMREAAVKCAEANGLVDFTPAEILRMAADQLDSEAEFVKTAAPPSPPIPVPGPGGGGGKGGGPDPWVAPTGPAVAPNGIYDDKVHVAQTAQWLANAEVSPEWLHAAAGIDPKAANYQQRMAELHKAITGQDRNTALATVKQFGTPTFTSRYGKYIAPAAAVTLLGGGAAYLMHKANRKRDEAIQAEIAEARARARAQGG